MNQAPTNIPLNMYCGLDYNRYLIYKDLFNKKKYKEEDS